MIPVLSLSIPFSVAMIAFKVNGHTLLHEITCLPSHSKLLLKERICSQREQIL